MKLTKGMTAEEMFAMIESEGWEITDEGEFEQADGTCTKYYTICQNGYDEVEAELKDGVIRDLEFLPGWAS